MIKMNHGLNG